jgi:cyclic-di-GMP-binding protein
MISDPHIQHLLKKLIVPQEDLTDLSFCGGNKLSHLEQWLKGLPLTQVQLVAAQLYTGLHEISRLSINYKNKLEMLEAMRVTTHQILDGLAQKYLNQPLILPENALKTATIAQAIQKHLLNSYLNSLLSVCKKFNKEDALDDKALLIHRALTALGLLLLRSYQLYLPIACQRWLEIHTLYQLACALDVESVPVHDNVPHHDRLRTIHSVYLRILLLATARSNQLRQDEIEHTYHSLAVLAPLADLDDYNHQGQENLYLILTDDNRPPVYKSHWRPGNNMHRATPLELHTQRLVTKLREEFKATTKSDAQSSFQINLSVSLIKHLDQAWSHLAQRTFDRQNENNDIEITLGLANIHFHIADEQPFSHFMANAKSAMALYAGADNNKKTGALLKPFLEMQDETEAEAAFDLTSVFANNPALTGQAATIEQETSKAHFFQQYPTYSVPMINRSPGGYGLEWRDEIPVQVRAGELLGLREYGRNKWAIGVVRWVHQIKGATQLGIQVIAPKAMAVGIAVIQNSGGFSEYLRALQIPELRAINQPTSLITNAISFHEYSRAKLYIPPPPQTDYEGDLTIQLSQRIFSTGAFSQFAFQITARPKPKDTSGANTKSDQSSGNPAINQTVNPTLNPKTDFDAAWE